MKAFGGYEKVRALSEREQLPPDGYVCRIMGAREVTYQGREGAFSRLEISLDIAEGEHTGYYADDYKAQSGEDRRWSCVSMCLRTTAASATSFPNAGSRARWRQSRTAIPAIAGTGTRPA